MGQPKQPDRGRRVNALFPSVKPPLGSRSFGTLAAGRDGTMGGGRENVQQFVVKVVIVVLIGAVAAYRRDEFLLWLLIGVPAVAIAFWLRYVFTPPD